MKRDLLKMSKTILFAIFALVLTSSINAKTIYVATWGNNSWAGTASKPYKTIQHGAWVAKWGDVVIVRPGTYWGDVTINSGGVTLNGSNRGAVLKNGAIKAFKKSNIKITGFKIMNGKNGVYVEGPANNITIENNHTYNTTASGIGVWGVRYGQNPWNGAMKNVNVKWNKVEKACNGGWNECITLAWGIKGFMVEGNEVLNGGNPVNGGEGIDIKGLCSDGTIHNNHVHHLTRRGIYLDGVKSIWNIKVTNNNCHHNKGQGIALMTEGGGDVSGIQVLNNSSYNNTEDGLMIYKHPAGGGKMYNVTVRNNKFYNNGRFGFLLNYSGSWNIWECYNQYWSNSNGNVKVITGGYIRCKSAESGTELSQESIKFYPNPANDVLNINFSSELINNAELAIYNSTGQMVVSQLISSEIEQLSLDNLSSGMYFIRITNGEEVLNKRFIKQ